MAVAALAHGGRALHDEYLGSIMSMNESRASSEDEGRAAVPFCFPLLCQSPYVVSS
ncbi:hypothetical protein [Desulfovibrio sp. JC010]|uniref:hypothetical protein n=1 Tax=Desulfovibrio sp. JC010 TaxID=2593641 RepID=UPI0013D65E8A|nr:hypothetical protein [Desulfovibrio sp. JC010]